MKRLRSASALILALLILLCSCGTAKDSEESKEEGKSRDSVVITEKVWPTRTNSKGENIPDVFMGGQPSEQVYPSENPITGKDAATKYHNSHKVVSVIKGSGKTENFSPWHDGREVDSLFDGADGFFRPDQQTKMGGGVGSNKLVVTFRTEKATLVGYALVTGNDSSGYPERSPAEWTFYGSIDGNTWTTLDYVYDSAIEPADHEYYGYEIDKENQAEYSYYKFEFTVNLMSTGISSFQLNECYLYADKS